MSEKLYRKTPIMGWASWNAFRTRISENVMKQQADALVSTGLAACGYTYLNMDDGFFGGRDKDGVLQFHKERFPNGIKPVADYAHALNLKAGIYSEGGDNTCAFYYDAEGDSGAGVGLYGHEKQDLEMYLEDCGFDFIKVDWCGGIRLALDEEEQFTKIGTIIDQIRHRTGREIVYNVCRWQFPGEWVTRVADSWRTGCDSRPNFASLLTQLDQIKPLAHFCSPGHVNDPDMMEIGNGLTFEEEKTQFAMWCMMSSPLIIGCDLTKIRPDTLSILKNQELIALNQDPACLQAFVIKSDDDMGEIYLKDLGEKYSKNKAIAFLNRSDGELTMELNLAKAGLTDILCIRNLWTHEDLPCTPHITVTLPPHGCAVYRITCSRALPIENPTPQFVPQYKPLRRITEKEVAPLIKKGACLVDVRPREDFAKAPRAGAVNIPYTSIHGQAPQKLKDRERPIILCCATGKRSFQAKQALENLGYQNIYYLGGIK